MSVSKVVFDEEEPVFDTPLVFNANLDTSKIKNILLIDSSVSESQLFFDSANSETFPIIYSYNSNRDDFVQLLETKFSNLSLERVSFVFHDNILKGKTFLNQELLFLESDILENVSTFSPNTQLLIDTIKKYNVKHVDFLACNSLNYSNWRCFYGLLTKQTSVIIGASNDKTGNLNYGGDWIMENTNENVVKIYFNDNITNYNSTLATTIEQGGGTIYIRQSGPNIEYQSNSTSGAWTTLTLSSWPVPFKNLTPAAGTILTISLFSDITISAATQGANGFFTTESSYITYDGTGKTVTIDGITGYLGFIQNGTSAINGNHAITVKNIKSAATGGSNLNAATLTRAGWICQAYFGCNINNIPGYVETLIDNCSNSATINNNSAGFGNGGIVGGRSFSYGTGIIQNCFNTGEIITIRGGGILGMGGIQNPGQIVSVTNCYNTGAISGQFAGGICGAQLGQVGTGTVTDCYNTGAISGTSAGGICGVHTGAFGGGSATITDCYNTGAISGSDAGGICGSSAGQDSGSATISNCYNIGAINSPYAGGICGSSTPVGNGTATISNCYNTGAISGSYAGGVTGQAFGYNTNNLCSITDCYNIGAISGLNAGGICGAEVGYNYDAGTGVTYTPDILIENCYSLGDISTTCGGILGGTDGNTYTNTPTVNITNCYTSYTSVTDTGSEYISNNLPIKASITLTSVYSQTIASWSDTSAKLSLTGSPTSIYSNNPGTTWATVLDGSPYLLSAFNSQIYSPNMYTNPDGNYTSNPGLFTPGNYQLLNVNNSETPSTITINASTGALTFGSSKFSHNSEWVEQVFVSNPSSLAPYYYGYNFNLFTLNQVLCFKEGTKILCFTDKEEYIPIEKLKTGDLVKTFSSGFKKIQHIGHSKMYHNVNEIRSKNKLYKCCNTEYPELTEDLVITGCHSILVKSFKDPEQVEKTQEVLGKIYITEKYYRLPACVDNKTQIFEEEGIHTIWHFSLENNDYYMNYGVYANGLLVETSSNRMMVELSGMKFI